MKPVSTMIVIAGYDRARFFLNEGRGKGLNEFAGISIDQFPADKAEYSDRPGRQNADRSGVGLHGFDPHQTPDEMHRARFSVHLVDALAEAWRERQPERLVIAAPPKMLGLLRSRLGKDLTAALVADIPKDLLKIPVHDLPGHFSDIVAL